MDVHLSLKMNKSTRTYFSGELISGQVIVATHTAQRLRERIYILLCGYSSTNLIGRKVKTIQSTELVPTNRRNSVGQEIYLQTKIFLTPEDSTLVELAAGQNGFPFEFHLPIHLPSTFYSCLGLTEYKAVASLSLEGLQEPLVHTINFRVINCQDLNLSEVAGRNSYYSFEKLIAFGSTRKKHGQQHGIINSTVKLQSQGFVPGQSIEVKLEIMNRSGLKLERVTVDLIREICYNCPAGSASETEVLDCWIDTDHMRRYGVFERDNILARLDVPINTLPTSSEITGLISMEYFVTINVQLESARNYITIGKIPVLVGTVPLRQLEYRNSARRRSSRQQRTSGGGPDHLELPGPSTSAASSPGHSRSHSPTYQRIIEGSTEGGAVGGAVGENSYEPSAPNLTTDESQDSEDLESEFPPSYSEAVGLSPSA